MTVNSAPERDAGVAGHAPPRGGDGEELLDRTAAALRRMLAVEPRNAAALAWLGDLERRRGDFPAALTSYRRLLAAAPDDASAAWAVAVLGGGRLPEAPPAVLPEVLWRLRMEDVAHAAQHHALRVHRLRQRRGLSGVPLRYARWRSGRTQGEVDVVRLDVRRKPRWCVEVKWSDRAGEHPEELTSLAAFADRHPGARLFVTSRTLTRRAVSWSRASRLDVLPTSFYCYAVGLSAVRFPSVDFDQVLGG